VDLNHLCHPVTIKPRQSNGGVFAACFAMSEGNKRINLSLTSKAKLTSLLSL